MGDAAKPASRIIHPANTNGRKTRQAPGEDVYQQWAISAPIGREPLERQSN
jgi:hypothetical protein